MKIFSLKTIVILAVLSVLPALTLFPKGKWKLLARLSYTNNVTIAGFLDTKNGITAGYAGEMHYTTDGGKRWPSGSNSSQCRFGLEILDKNSAWTSGNAGNVRYSEDGGATWLEKTGYGNSEPDQCRYISFADESTGWIASPTNLAATYDGAGSWTEVKLPAEVKDIAGIHLLSKDHGYILGSDGNIFETKDGGNIWSMIKTDYKGTEFISKIPRAPAAAFRFTDMNKGILIANVKGEKMRRIVLETKNGGKSWTEDNIPGALKSKNLSMQVVFLNRDASLITVNDWYEKVIYILGK